MQRICAQHAAEAFLNKLLTSRVTGIALDNIIPFELGDQMCCGSLANTWRAVNHDRTEDATAVRTSHLEPSLEVLRVLLQPSLEPLDDGFVAANLVQRVWCVFGCPQASIYLGVSALGGCIDSS